MSARRQELEASWAITREHLENAFALLPASSPEDQEFSHWLYHNELGLALMELERLGEQSQVDRSFWEYMRKAATQMKLSDDAIRYQEKQSSEQTA